MSDYSDHLVGWCWHKQTMSDPERRPLYFGGLKAIAEERQSEQLSMKAMTLASQGDVTQQELQQAYQTIGVDPQHWFQLTDAIIMSTYRGRYPDSGPAQKEEMRKALLTIGHVRGSNDLLDSARDSMYLLSQVFESHKTLI